MTGSKFGRFICPNCTAINVEAGSCKKCGADLETGEATGDSGTLREMTAQGGPDKKTLIIGGVAVLLILSAAMMMFGGSKPAPAPAPTATGTAPATGTGTEGESAPGDLEKAKKIATQYAGFKAVPPEGYAYKDTSSDTPGLPSFGLESEPRNQKVMFLVWDNTAPVDNLDLVIGKVPFTEFGIDVTVKDRIKVKVGSAIIGPGEFNYFVGRYPVADKQQMALVGAYKSPMPGKAIVVVARPFSDSDKLDYESTLWLIDDMAAEYTAKSKNAPEGETTTGTTSSEASGEEKPLATPEALAAYNQTVQDMMKIRFSVTKEEAGKSKSTVIIAIDNEGKLSKLEVEHPSGNEVVDKTVLKAIQNSQPYPAPPHTKGPLKLEVTTNGAELSVAAAD